MSWILNFGKKPQQQQQQQDQQQNIPTSVNDTNSINNTNTEDERKQLNQTLGFDQQKLNTQTKSLHDFANLDKGVESLDLDEEKLSNLEGSQGLIPSRGWNDDLCYGTGAVYLSGLGVGGLYGFFEGLSKIPPNAPGKLQLNTLLNNITKRGPFLGNNAGVMALSYNIFNSSLDYYRGKHDHANSIAAGFLSGALFKSTKGLKPMGYAGGLTALAAAGWCGLKEYLI
ncbi:Mitochondrial import inner membrane translocase subunit tim23 [Hanseniaspora osmophila]